MVYQLFIYLITFCPNSWLSLYVCMYLFNLFMYHSFIVKYKVIISEILIRLIRFRDSFSQSVSQLLIYSKIQSHNFRHSHQEYIYLQLINAKKINYQHNILTDQDNFRTGVCKNAICVCICCIFKHCLVFVFW